MIDWNGKLEVHDPINGTHAVHPLRPNPHQNSFWPFVAWCPELGQDFYVNKDKGEVNDGQSTGCWTIRNVKEEKAVTEFRVGDRVRCTKAFNGLTVGKEYFVSEIRDGSPLVIDDDGDANLWGNMVKVEGADNELATLRAFKEMALERYPDLEPKVETDLEAAERFAEEYYDNSETVADVVLRAVAWARANPRD